MHVIETVERLISVALFLTNFRHYFWCWFCCRNFIFIFYEFQSHHQCYHGIIFPIDKIHHIHPIINVQYLHKTSIDVHTTNGNGNNITFQHKSHLDFHKLNIHRKVYSCAHHFTSAFHVGS